MPRFVLRQLRPSMLFLAGAEFILGMGAVYLGALIRFAGGMPVDVSHTTIFLQAFSFSAVIVACMTAMGLYQMRQRLKIEGIAVRVVIAFGLSALINTLIFYTVPALALGRGWWVLSLAAAFLLTTVSRIIFSNIADNDLLRRRVIVYGAGRRASTLLQLRRRSDQRGFRIVSFIPTAGDEFVISDDRVARTERSLFEHANENEAEQIVMAMDDRRRAYPIEDLHKCKFSGIDVIDIVEFLERESGKVKIDLLNPSSIIFASRFTRGDSPVLVSSLFDIVVALVTLVLALPIMLITALGILLEDGRPILYRQTRVGRQGRDFELLKFRSMRKDAEKDGARWAEMQDSRVTRIGSIIRPLRIDELPQLLNILRGDMRIIGPRPERPEFVEQLVKSIPYYHERHSVKPGLTGWAQLCYPYGASEKDAFEKLQFDLYYVKHRSLVFDLVILLQTVEVILWKKGAR